MIIQQLGLLINTSPKMKFAIALLFCIVAAVSANYYDHGKGYGGYKDYGFDKPQNL